MDIEDRIFELSDETLLPSKIVPVLLEEYDIDPDTAWDLVVKVRHERGTPNIAAAREAIAELQKLSYY